MQYCFCQAEDGIRDLVRSGFFFDAEKGIRDAQESRGLGDGNRGQPT